jgi:1,4-alpha-glucan branching enzyme
MNDRYDRKRVTFKLYAPSAREVLMAGSLSNRRETARPLKRCKDGTWRTTISLHPGIHEYRFIVNGVCHDDLGSKTRQARRPGIFNCVIWV